MTAAESQALADHYRDLVLVRTGLKPSEIICPREKSDMTPCVARDGGLAASDDGWCVGCDKGLRGLVDREEAFL